MANDSKITTDLEVDDALEQDANYRFDSNDRQYIDNQVLGISQHLVDALIKGKHATYVKLDLGSASVVTGDVVCLSTSSSGTVTKAVPAALATAKVAFGVVARPASPGSNVLVVTGGAISPSVTGLSSGVGGFVRVSSTARCERVASLEAADASLGYVNPAGWMRVIPGYAVGGGGGGGDGDATSIRGISVSSSAPSLGDSLVYNVGANQWRPSRPVPPSWYNVIDYGADPTGVADSAAAINAAIHAAAPVGSTGPGGLFGPGANRGAVVYIPRGTYKLSSSIIVDRSIILEGVGTPGWFSDTILKADDGVTAIVVSSGPVPALGAGPGDGTGAWSVIRNLTIFGPGNGLSNPPGGSIPNCHGLDIWVTCSFEHLYISGFTGNGVNLVSTNGIRGNANCCRGSDSFFEYCEIGMYIDGADVNASTFVGLSATNCRSWGIYDSSFLGCTHIGHHVRGPDFSLTAGAYKNEGPTNVSAWIGCYSEEGHFSEFDRPCTVLGGLHGSPNRGTASCPASNTYTEHQAFTAPDWAPEWAASTAVFARFSVMTPPAATFLRIPVWYMCITPGTTGAVAPDFATAATAGATLNDGTAVWRCMGNARTSGYLGSGAVGADAIAFNSDDVTSPWRLTYSRQRWKLRWANSDSFNAMVLTGPPQYPGPERPQFPNGVILGQAFDWTDPGRAVTFASAAPTVGYWRRGSVVHNSAPSAGGTPGWVCTTSGMSSAPARANSTYYRAGDVVRPAVANGYVYQCIQAIGTNSVSGGAPPVFPTTLDATVTDGDLTWVCAGVNTGPVFKAMANLAA